MKIAIEGCAHGDIEKIYAAISMLEKRNNIKVDLLICCGDFQSVRNKTDLKCLAAPAKYREMKSFYKYYSGELQAPLLTIFIGGNHEASNYLAELPNGGWVCPNIYFLGYANVLQIGGLRIAGLTGIFKSYNYFRGHFECFPYNNDTVRSVYHVRQLETFRLKQINEPIDIFLSHDWPRGMPEYGDVKKLLRRKPYFRQDIESGHLGSEPCAELLHKLKPRYWFSAHLHVKFSAFIEHNDESKNVTRFLALDKCLPHRDFLQILDIPHDEEKPLQLHYDPEWLCILKTTDHLLSTSNTTHYMPGPGCDERYDFSPTTEEKNEIIKLFNDDLVVPLNFTRTAPIHKATTTTDDTMEEPQRAQCNPQNTELCSKLNITDLQKTLIDKTKVDGSCLSTSFSHYSSFVQSPSLSQRSLNPDEISLSDNDEVSDCALNPNKTCSDTVSNSDKNLDDSAEVDLSLDKSDQQVLSPGNLFVVDKTGDTLVKKPLKRRNWALYAPKDDSD